MTKMSKDTGIQLDEELKIDLGLSSERESNSAVEDRKIEEAVKRARVELKTLLNQPIDLSSHGTVSNPSSRGPGKKIRGEKRKRDAFVVFAK